MTQRDTWLKVCGWPMREHKPGGRLLGECKLNPPGGAASHLLPWLTLGRLTVGGRGGVQRGRRGRPPGSPPAPGGAEKPCGPVERGWTVSPCCPHEGVCPHEGLHTRVHSSFACSSRKLETTQMSIEGQANWGLSAHAEDSAQQ